MRKPAILLTSLLCCSVLVLALAAHASEDRGPAGWLWGEVTTAENQPAPNVVVSIAKVENEQTVPPAITGMTDAQGRYLIDISQLSAGQYLVIVNPGPSMAGGHLGGQTIVALNGPNTSKRLDWRLSQSPPVLPLSE